MRRRDIVGDHSASADGVNLTLPARPPTVRIIRRAVRQFATTLRCNDQQTFELQAAIGEAVTNAIVHAYPGTPGIVRVKVWRTARAIHAQIEDHGTWAARPATGLGMGLRIMETFADDAKIDSTTSGTTVLLSFSRTDAHRSGRIITGRV